MIIAVRRLLALVAGCGFVASFVIYIGSYVGTTMDNLARWPVVLHIGVFFLLVPMFAVEHSALRERTFWKSFAQGLPKWVAPGIKLLGLFCIIHFVLFLVQSHAASPQIKDGQYVLNDHGRIVTVLTEPEYLRLKGAELRLFATGWMFFYFVSTMYWWFPRNHQRTGKTHSLSSDGAST
jgi:hypothetical protein